MISDIFLETARVVRNAVSTETVARHWDDDSALEGYSVSGLAGHTVRAILTPLTYLRQPAPEGDPVGPAEYFVHALANYDPIESLEHATVRDRGQRAAAEGPAALVERADEAIAELEQILRTIDDNRLVTVFSDLVMNVDEYLVTRILEMVIHLDDLASSVSEPLPQPPGDAIDLTLATSIEIAAIRHGHTALLRALTRRERIDEYPYAF